MSRRPKEPRYYPSRKAYYVQLCGKKLLLAKGEQDDPEVLAKAWERFREVAPEKKSKVVAVTDEEYMVLSENADSHLRPVINTLFWIGCRPSEVCTIAADHLEREQAVRIGKRRLKGEAIFDWLFCYPERTTGRLFLNKKNRPWTVDAIHEAFCRLRDRLGLRKELTPFSFRHAFALNFLKIGLSVTDLAAVLGIAEKQARKLYGPGTSGDPKLKEYESLISGEQLESSPDRVLGKPHGESDCTPFSR